MLHRHHRTWRHALIDYMRGQSGCPLSAIFERDCASASFIRVLRPHHHPHFEKKLVRALRLCTSSTTVAVHIKKGSHNLETALRCFIYHTGKAAQNRTPVLYISAGNKRTNDHLHCCIKRQPYGPAVAGLKRTIDKPRTACTIPTKDVTSPLKRPDSVMNTVFHTEPRT